jgi:opacity protein-like surface antigen
MKTSPLTQAAIASLFLLTVSAVQADETSHSDSFTGNVSGYLGNKTLDDNDWGKLDQQGSLGVIFDFKKESWPVSIAADVIVSGNVKETGSSEELAGSLGTHLGVRNIFKLSNASFQPYIGGGISLISTELRNKNAGVTISKSDDSATGTWLGTGMYYALNNHFNIGVDLRYSEADVTLFNVERKVGGMHSGITIGYHW